jgi:ADP-heptose:LPS heptosyltransferase
VKRLVVLRALGLGDLLTAVPALRALAAAFPAHRRLLAAPAALAPLARLSGAVDEVVATAPLAPLDPSLRGADVAVNLHGCGPQSHALLLETGPRRLVAFAHPDVPASGDGPRWRRGEHEVARWSRLLAESGIPADRRALGLPLPPLLPSAAHRGAVLVHPGAASGARRWPPGRWACLAREIEARGLHVLLTGSAGEVGLAENVAALAGLPSQSVLAGRTDLLRLAALVAHARCVLSGDTGIAHLATAFGTPSVVLFGPTSPAEWGPPDGGPHEVLWHGSTGDPHGDSVDPGLAAIGVDDAVGALDRALSSC